MFIVLWKLERSRWINIKIYKVGRSDEELFMVKPSRG
jgi:hypothetical protein